MTRVVVCFDGLDPAYIDATGTPEWDDLAAAGAAGECAAAMPTLTNVNNVGLATASPPADHGITGNTYFDPETGERSYMRTADHRRAETWFAARERAGESVAALVTKEKLRGLIATEASTAASAEAPPAWLESAVGEAPDIYSGDASAWLLDAGVHVLREHEPDWLYLSTTDVVPHKHAPGTEAADAWVRALDDRLGRLAAESDALVATADHGMNVKTLCVDPEAILAERGDDAEVIRLIRDAHTYHHQNLGGAAYAYATGETEPADLLGLADVDGVEAVLERAEAAERFDLPPDRIGDVLLLGTETSVFGPVEGGEATHAEVSLRSHGSTHERTVPYVSTEQGSIDNGYEAFSLLADAE
ncbi:alkaline phosphatase family protein [Halobaculum gomorrense]|uniref:Phosphonoacetate hydrolase n=1 Tax=Halobaculum gomorrense TaxID=43928 RepID=A0A1M5JL12_9EURY|nr:alkaline phosphatase family protein [Halobaculum gomorrense]SHG41264.1 phosphonoacetate hydrolase [Halobaculum gomorrense]